MKAFVAIVFLAATVAGKPQSYSTFTGYGHNYGYNHDSHDNKHHNTPYNTPEPLYYNVEPHTPYTPAPYKPTSAPYKPTPAPYKPEPYTPAPYHPKPEPYTPAPYHPKPTYGQHHHGYGYEQPKHNCTIQDVTETAEVCTPAFETSCENVELPIKNIVDKEFCYDVTRTVCTESIEEIPNEICSYNYQKKQVETTAKTVEVTFKKETNTQMVTVCQPGYGHGYHQYGHQYCKEVAQETAYNVPVINPLDVDVTVAYPEPIKTCINKPISLPRVSCSDLTEKKCINVPEIEESTESVEKCVTKLGEPSCQKVELTLPKQVCIELVYGYAEDEHKSYKHQ